MRQDSVDVGGGPIGPELEQTIQAARSSGRALGPDVRRSMEHSFGTDFQGVKIHTDARSDALNRSLQSRAFTTGKDIFFRKGEYQPQNAAGKRLLAHELTHTIQQRGGQLHRRLIQRDVGFEFEVPSSITRRAVPPLTSKEKSGERALPMSRGDIADRVYNRRFGRQDNVGKLHPLHKFAKILQGDHFTLESDDSNAGGTNMEFVTSLPPFPETRAGRVQMIETLHRIRDVVAYLISRHPLPVIGRELEERGFGTAMIPNGVITLLSGNVTGNPQTTAAIRLDQIARVMSEIGAAQPGETGAETQERAEGRSDLQGQSGGADRVLVGNAAGDARTAVANLTHDSQGNAVPGGIGSNALTGLLALMLSYLRKADGGAQAYAKGIAPLMARTDFATMFRALRKKEQRFFAAHNAREWIHLVLSAANTQTGVNGNTPLFRSGLVYLADVQGMSQAQVDLYRRRLNGLTKDLWLTEMVKGTDVLSTKGWLKSGGAPGLGDEFESLGALGGRKEGVGANAEVPAPIFEMRRMNQNVDYTEWTGIAVGIFDYLMEVNQKRQATYSKNKFW